MYVRSLCFVIYIVITVSRDLHCTCRVRTKINDAATVLFDVRKGWDSNLDLHAVSSSL